MPAMDEFRQHWSLVELDIVSGFHTDPVGLLLSHRADWAIVSEVEQNDDVFYLSRCFLMKWWGFVLKIIH